MYARVATHASYDATHKTTRFNPTENLILLVLLECPLSPMLTTVRVTSSQISSSARIIRPAKTTRMTSDFVFATTPCSVHLFLPRVPNNINNNHLCMSTGVSDDNKYIYKEETSYKLCFTIYFGICINI